MFMYKCFGKRIMDLIFAIICTIIALPFFVIIATAIKVDSKGPVLFLQDRLGINGKRFRIFKFRTMCIEAEQQGTGVYSFKGDPRITRVGRILRITSIDETAQLINILKGDMSFIGPRPVLTYHPCKYEEYTEEQRKQFTIRPGVSGWAQVHGRNAVDWEERIKMNVWYAEYVSFLLDAKILFMTIGKILCRANTTVLKDTSVEFKKKMQA